jgi:hypothetical protein
VDFIEKALDSEVSIVRMKAKEFLENIKFTK